jgi:transposase
MKDIMAGIDLHSNNLMVALMDQTGARLFHKKLPCEWPRIEQALAPYQARIKTIAVESTFNWYWLVDGLQDRGYDTVLTNVAAIQQYEGIKHTDDQHDAFWLAEMLRLNILPTGHIYDRALRPVRDLLRRRLGLVRKRTSLILGLKSLHHRMHGSAWPLAEIKRSTVDQVWRRFEQPADQLLAREAKRLIQEIDLSIQRLEDHILKQTAPLPEYQRLLTIPGVGQTLGMTIALETGDPKRFASPGDFASYCRTVRSERTSNGRKKGKNNSKCGNRYLSWAFVEAAHCAIRYDSQAKRFYEQKKAKTNTMVATKALACKLAKAAWHIVTQKIDYDGSRVFGPSRQTSEDRMLSFPQGTEVEKQLNKEKQAGEKNTSPVENPQLSDQTVLGLHSCRALSSAGKAKTSRRTTRTKTKKISKP